MATDLETLLVRIDATTEGLRRELKKADRAVDQSGRNMEKSLSKIDKQFSEFGKGLASAFTVAAMAKIGKEVLLAADRYRTLQGRIKEATRDTGDYASVSKELFAISQRTGTALEGNVAMFQRLATGAREFGASNEDILKVTETVQKLGIIGGTSAASISAGTMQFAQAMAAGVVRAEEWNSVVENMPELAVAIADSFGKTAGQMRQMILDGEVLSKDVFGGLAKRAEEVAARFDVLPTTIDQAVTKIQNAFDEAAGESDEFQKSLQTITSLLEWLAKNMDGIFGPLNKFMAATRREMEALAAAARATQEFLARMGIGNGPEWVVQSSQDWKGSVGNFGRTARVAADMKVSTGKPGKADALPDPIDGGFVGKSGAAFPIDESAWFDPQEQADRIARLKEEGDAVRAVVDPVFALAQETDKLQTLLDEGAISAETYGAALGKIEHQALLAAETMEGGFARALQGLEQSLSNIDWFAGDIFKQIGRSFKGLVNDMINEAFRLSVIQPLMKSIFGAASGGSGGGVFGSIFGIGSGTLGTRAGGGPVTANTPYLVGERGPDMFVPGSSGGIVPNHKMGGGQAVVVNIHNHYDVGLEGVDQRIRQHTPKIAAQAAQAVRNANQRTAGAFIR